jgi:hypothetical protein
VPTRAYVTLNQELLGLTSSKVVEALRAGDPSVWVRHMDETIVLSVETLVGGDEEVLLQELKKALKQEN